MRWFCKCVETWGPAQLDEIICMLDCWISVISHSARTDGGDGEMEGRARSVWSAGWQDGHMLSASSLPASLPACPLPAPPHGYFINIIMSWILKDFSQQENRGLLCHDLAIYTLPMLPLLPPPYSLHWYNTAPVQWLLLRIMSSPL